MRKAIGVCGAAFLLALSAGCEREEAVEVPAAAEPDGISPGIRAPYVIEPLDGRVTVDTQRFDLPAPPDAPGTELPEEDDPDNGIGGAG